MRALRPKEGGGRTRRMLRLAGVLVLGGLLAGTLGVLGGGRWSAPWHGVLGTAAARPQATATSPAPSSQSASATPDQMLAQAKAIVAAAAAPTRVLVPSINVDAPVEPVGLDAQGRMANPSQASNVAWYRLGTAPGDVGTAVLAGHLDWTSGPAVFWSLGKVRKGDVISVVRADGTQVKFVTESTSTVPYDLAADSPANPLYSRSGPPSLTLITCSGSWDRQHSTYLQRLLVHASLVPTLSPSRPGDEGG